jgi:uncharacterized protein
MEVRMDAVYLLSQHFHTPKSFAIVLEHSRAVAELALELAAMVPHMTPDCAFIEEAALLHDIGVSETAAIEIDCHGPHPYLCHGIIGAAIVSAAGYPHHARVCECHIGVGLRAADIRQQGLPLPHRDMCPQSIEEIIITLADLFYSKRLLLLRERKTISTVKKSLAQFGHDKLELFDQWLTLFPPVTRLFKP